MSLGLESLAPCFQGIVPAMFFTCAKDGTPNAAFLSHVDYVDPTHVALSFQFFNKSRRNIEENPQALVRVIDPDTHQGYALRLRYLRSETSGPIFDRMYLRIEAIASYSGLKGIFKLRAADIYEVESVELVPEQTGVKERWSPRSRARQENPVFTMKALQEMAVRINTADNLETLLETILAGLKEFFGFSHSMILLTGEKPNTLVTIASRGYPQRGAGAEVQFGEGIIGVAAEAQKPIRISGLLRGMLHARAVAMRAMEKGWSPERQVPLPGLENPESQLGVPLVVRGELIGVICIESETPYRFHEDDKTTIEMLGSHLAIAIQNMQLREKEEGMTTPRAAAPPAGASASQQPRASSGSNTGSRREVTYYRGEEVLMVDGEYLIRSLPARILWKLLNARQREGRSEFTNRELRLDKSLNLPDFKDNLETRLLLLRRRLEEKEPDIRMVPKGRGRFALELGCGMELVEKP
jgi:putative methionine-R-sulfoxide reductase with GAF domain